MDSSQKPEAGHGEITLVVAQSPRYYPHVARHLKSLKKAFPRVRLLYWEKDGREPLYSFPEVEVERLILPFGGGTWFFLRLMAGFFLRIRRMAPESIEAIDPYALVPARLYALLPVSLRAGIAKPAPVRIAYFSMEYFTQLPSLRAKPWKRSIWRRLERWGAAGAATAATVCDSIAAHLSRDFGMPVITVRNVPERSDSVPDRAEQAPGGAGSVLHTRCGVAWEKPILIYQGMLQEGRGLETAVRALGVLADMHLAIIGGGPLGGTLRTLAQESGCADRVHLLGEVDFRELVILTRGAFAGLAFFQALSESYRYSLPGKLFEYIQAGVPVIATSLPEILKVVTGYRIGLCLEENTPAALAAALSRLRGDTAMYRGFRENMLRARAELCWESEEVRYLSLYR